jgi:hypothetical protein
MENLKRGFVERAHFANTWLRGDFAGGRALSATSTASKASLRGPLRECFGKERFFP